MVQAFRKELSDLRQQEIERAASRPTASRAHRRGARRASAAIANALHRLADRLEPAPELPIETRKVVIRQP